VKQLGKAVFRYQSRTRVVERLHCLLHVKELKVTTTELEMQIGD